MTDSKQDTITSDDVNDPESLLQYIKTYERTIYVRRNLGEGWKTYALADLPPDHWAEFVWDSIARAAIPYRIIEDGGNG